MKKRVRNKSPFYFLGITIFAILIIIGFILVSFSNKESEGKNIFQKALENIKNSYLRITGKAISLTFCVCNYGDTTCDHNIRYECTNPCQDGGYSWKFIDYGCGTCTPSCLGKACGSDDGCGNPCQTGSCPSGQSCSNGKCRGGCIPNCNGKDCGSGGCSSNDCGSCYDPAKPICSNGKCICKSECTKNELGKKKCKEDSLLTCVKNSDGCHILRKPSVKCDFGCNTILNKCNSCPKKVQCEKGSKKCDEKELFKIKECYYDTKNKCFRWGDTKNCPAGQTCKNNKCEACNVLTCENIELVGILFETRFCGQFDNNCRGKTENCRICLADEECIEGECKGIECSKNEDCYFNINEVKSEKRCYCNPQYSNIYCNPAKCENPGTYDSYCNYISYIKTVDCNYPSYGCVQGESECSKNECDINNPETSCNKEIKEGNCRLECKKVYNAYTQKNEARCVAGKYCGAECDEEKPCLENDYNPCTKQICNSKKKCETRCINEKIDPETKKWRDVNWGETGAKILTISELIEKFKNEELKKSENDYNSKNIKNFDEIIQNDPELKAAIIYKELILKNRLTFVIFYEGDRKLGPEMEKEIKEFIKLMSRMEIFGKPVELNDYDKKDILKPQFLIIDVSCKGLDVFNKLQKLKNLKDTKTYPQGRLMPAFTGMIKFMKSKDVYEKLVIFQQGITFSDKLRPIIPYIDSYGLFESSGIGIAVYTNTFGNIATYVPFSYDRYAYFQIMLIKYTLLGLEPPEPLILLNNLNLINLPDWIRKAYPSGLLFFKKDKDFSYTLNYLSLGPSYPDRYKNALEAPIKEVLDKLKIQYSPQNIKCN